MKDLFGIEGVRIALRVHGEPRLADGIIAGELVLETLRDRSLEALAITLTERYARGRGQARLIDTYELGTLTQATDIALRANEQLAVPFELRFRPRLTPLERRLAGRPFGTAVGKLAKLTLAAASTYELHASAAVKGVKLSAQTTIPLSLA